MYVRMCRSRDSGSRTATQQGVRRWHVVIGFGSARYDMPMHIPSIKFSGNSVIGM